MPNGRDRNWVRLTIAVRGFRSRYGDWPTRVKLHPEILRDLRSLFLPDTFTRLCEKLELIPATAENGPALVAEDESGRSFLYGESWPDSDAEGPLGWLGVQPDAIPPEVDLF